MISKQGRTISLPSFPVPAPPHTPHPQIKRIIVKLPRVSQMSYHSNTTGSTATTTTGSCDTLNTLRDTTDDITVHTTSSSHVTSLSRDTLTPVNINSNEYNYDYDYSTISALSLLSGLDNCSVGGRHKHLHTFDEKDLNYGSTLH